MEKQLKVSAEMIGKFVNRYLYTDIQQVGQIVGTKGKTTIIIELYEASENKSKMEFIPGGFSAICLNNHSQDYDFTATGKMIEMRIGKAFYKQYEIEQKPYKHYDYNF
jgi:hypothetical protein